MLSDSTTSADDCNVRTVGSTRVQTFLNSRRFEKHRSLQWEGSPLRLRYLGASVRFYWLLLAFFAISVLAAPLDAQRRGSRSSSGRVQVHGYTRRDGTHVAPYTRSSPRSYSAPSHPRSYSTPRAYRAPTRPRAYASPDARGRIPRSRSERENFMRSTGYPRGRPGYVVDHVVPLCAGGADAPSNMQWQTVEDAQVKDRQERATCAARRH